MDRVYLLQHERPDTEDVKTIGIYASDADARAAVQRMVQLPGFSDYPDGFSIGVYELNKDHWAAGFVDL